MSKRKYASRDPQQALIFCYCRRCAREVYSPADGVRLGRGMLCTDCVRFLSREVRP